MKQLLRIGVVAFIIFSFLLGILFSQSTYLFAESKKNTSNKIYAAADSKQITAVKKKPKKIKRRRTVYDQQAQCVGKLLNLSEEQTDTLKVIYRELRKSRKLELTKYPNKQDKEYKKIAYEIEKNARANLFEKMKEIMSIENAKKAIVPLASFNPRWDGYVAILASFGLKRDIKSKVIRHTLEYAIKYEKGKRTTRKGSINHSSGKKYLDKKLMPLLTKEQYDEWNNFTKRRSNSKRKRK